MRTKILFFFSMLFIMSFPHLAKAQWTLVWSDEFEESISSDWTFEVGMGDWGWGNNEQQYYREENASIVDGMLQIQALKESYGDASYTSARLKTQGLQSFKYGKVEARISMPSFTGVWPAFWMLGESISSVSWPGCGEIDIVEAINTENIAYGTCHWEYNGHASYSGNTSVDITEFHVYAIEWDEEYIRWYVDGEQFHEIYIADGTNGTEEFHDEFYIILNVAIGGEWPGYTIDETAMPANMLVDYVRVYQESSSDDEGDDENDDDATTTTIEAEDYSDASGVQIETCDEGGQNVGYIDTGDWMAYNSIEFPSSGTYTLQYRVASEEGGQLSLDLNASSIVLGTADIPATGDWQTWTTVTQTVTVDAGTYNVGIYASQGGWNLNWFSITEGTLKSTSQKRQDLQTATAKLSVYPIPANEKLFVSGIDDACEAQVIDLQGKTLMSTQLSNGQEGIDISKLNHGIFFLRVMKEGSPVTLKFVK